jgi:hypothetical protein
MTLITENGNIVKKQAVDKFCFCKIQEGTYTCKTMSDAVLSSLVWKMSCGLSDHAAGLYVQTAQ